MTGDQNMGCGRWWWVLVVKTCVVVGVTDHKKVSSWGGSYNMGDDGWCESKYGWWWVIVGGSIQNVSGGGRC